jgi:nucleotide-binding universal stress UspA family protein
MKILVPVDGSQNALAGVRHALRLVAGQPDGQVWLANVQPELNRHISQFVSRRTIDESRAARARAAMREAEGLVEGAGVRSRSVLLVGEPSRAIADYADRERFDHIVMGTSRKSPLLRVLSGSIANRLVAIAQVPVSVLSASPASALQRYGIPAGLGFGVAALLIAAD